jgi:hypothetical protein
LNGVGFVTRAYQQKNKGGKATTHLCICWFVLSFGFFNVAIAHTPIFALLAGTLGASRTECSPAGGDERDRRDCWTL